MLPASGAISMSQINNSGTATVDMQSLVSRVIGGKPGTSQAISLSNFYYTQTATKTATLLSNPQLGYSSIGLGASMAISSDGNTVASANTTYDRVFVFTRANGSWTQEWNVANQAIGVYSFGSSLALSGDGNTLVVGVPQYHGGTSSDYYGTAYIYTRSGTTWTLLQQLSYSNRVGTTVNFGYSVAISEDGSTVIVGGQNQSSGAGAIWIYEMSGSTYTETAYFLGAGGSMLGSDVDCSANGRVVVAGTYQQGVRIYTKSGSTWSLQQSIKVAPTQGGTVTISADGKFIVSGSGWALNATAHTIVYKNGVNGLQWYNGGDILPPSGEANVSAFGWTTKMSADANVLVMGSWQGDVNNNGKTWIYEKTGADYGGSSYTHKATLVGESTSYAGYSVAVSGNGSVIASGAQYRFTPGPGNTGAIYIYS